MKATPTQDECNEAKINTTKCKQQHPTKWNQWQWRKWILKRKCKQTENTNGTKVRMNATDQMW